VSRRFTRHSFNRVHWIKVRRELRRSDSAVRAAEPAPAPAPVAQPSPPIVKLDLRGAPSGMDVLAERWKGKR
jgi:hypothetical protein